MVRSMPHPGSRLPRLAAGALLATLLLGAIWIDRTSGATGPAVIRLTDVQTASATVKSGSNLGKVQIFHVKLYGSGSRSKAIGHGIVTCMVVATSEQSCGGTYVLPRGMILTGGVLQRRLFYTAAITGGTGLYDNARGTLTVTANRLRPRHEILLFRLSG